MVRDPNKDLFDVVIIDATGRPADCSLRLQADLLGRDLRVRIEVAVAADEAAGHLRERAGVDDQPP